jgi:hypothetical protein
MARYQGAINERAVTTHGDGCAPAGRERSVNHGVQKVTHPLGVKKSVVSVKRLAPGADMAAWKYAAAGGRVSRPSTTPAAVAAVADEAAGKQGPFASPG